MKLVFVHGVGNVNEDANALKSAWITALLNGGLDAGRLAAADPGMAYYADLLDAGVGKASTLNWSAFDAQKLAFLIRVTGFVAKAYVGAADAENRELMRKASPALLPAIAAKANADFSTGPGNSITNMVRDILDEVYDYLTKPKLRAAIDARVAQSLIDGPMTIIGHSLGSVVAYRLLRDRGGQALAHTHFITMGSPLRLVKTLGVLDKAFDYPAQLGSWLNVFDRMDMVALGAPIPNPIGAQGRVTQFRVNNPHISQHFATGYLPTGPIIKRLQALL